MMDIHPQLQTDCMIIGRFKLCHVLLMKDANYPWCILVPDRDDMGEIYQLDPADQQRVLHESSLLGKVLMELFAGHKLNIAALGNVVPQLHIHHVVRFSNDPAWPAPVWGRVAAKPYEQQALTDTVQKIRTALAGELVYDEN